VIFISVALPHTPFGVSESNPVAAHAPVGTVKSVFRTLLLKCGGRCRFPIVIVVLANP
jgi:hypothetical protein